MLLAEWHNGVLDLALVDTLRTLCTASLGAPVLGHSLNEFLYGVCFPWSIVGLPFTTNDSLQRRKAIHAVLPADVSVNVTIDSTDPDLLVIFQLLTQVLEFGFQHPAVASPSRVEDNHPNSRRLCIRPMLTAEIDNWIHVAAFALLGSSCRARLRRQNLEGGPQGERQLEHHCTVGASRPSAETPSACNNVHRDCTTPVLQKA
mmetsp:Transcript_102852/g.193424  ORF Transcript_102852/g.193424 Transcript_102852/m.193424 type:complete len:203 (+) Transcript_102852:502-1110(+)